MVNLIFGEKKVNIDYVLCYGVYVVIFDVE